MTSTMEQSMNTPSVESLPGATTDPTVTRNKLKKVVDQLNANMDRMSTFLGQLCQHFPTGEYSHKAQETISHDLTGTGGTKEPGHKQQHSELSLSSDKKTDGPYTKSRKDSDVISIAAMEEEVQNLLDGFTGGAHTKTSMTRVPKTMMKFLRS